MLIKKFLRINGYRIFGRFSWPNGLKPFAQFNVVYGWNGTGKTTVASLFEKLQRKERVVDGSIEIECDNGNRILGNDFDRVGLPQVRVFDRDFVDQSVDAIGDGMAPPVYYIGEHTIEQAKRLQELKDQCKALVDKKEKADKEKLSLDKEFDKYITTQAKLVKDMMIGSKVYGTYNKTRLTEGIEKARLRNPALLTEEEKKGFLQERQASPMAGIVLQSLDLSCVREVVRKGVMLLSQSIVSATIDELVGNPVLSEWVRTGLSLHEKANGDCTCLFCGNAFSKAQRLKFENHFNDAYTAFVRQIEDVIDDVSNVRTQLRSYELSQPHASQFYESLAGEYERVRIVLKKRLEELDQFLSVLDRKVKEKKANPFASISVEGLDTTGEALIVDVSVQLNGIEGIVSRHAEFTANIETTKRRAEDAIVGDVLRSLIETYDIYLEKIKLAQKAIEDLAAKLRENGKEIVEIERTVTEGRTPVLELNAELAAYLGRDELQFKLKDSGYSLTRNGYPAENLSEGERTAITFLYFLKTLRTKSFDLGTGVVVVDDPVSSLDANSLFAAFSYMRGRLQGVGQLFILTHNFPFFRNVKNWFKHINQQCRDQEKPYKANFYSLEAVINDGIRTSRLTQLDPLLEKYESEYHYLFEQVYECANLTEEQGQLKQYCPLPNVARRLLDAFLSFKFPDCNAESLSQKLRPAIDTAIDNDVGLQQRLLRFLNTYSHVDGMPTPEYDMSLLAESRSIMRLIMQLIEKLDKGHYDRMVRVLNRRGR